MTTPEDARTELKPCPFCGGPAEFCHAAGTEYWIRCASAGVCFGSVEPGEANGFTHASDAVEFWNTRATIPKAKLTTVQHDAAKAGRTPGQLDKYAAENELLRHTLANFHAAAIKAGLVVSDEHYRNARDQMSVEYRDLYNFGRRARFVLAHTRDEAREYVATLIAAAWTIPALKSALRECEEYLDQRADAEYVGEALGLSGNEEMTLLMTVRAALSNGET